MSLDRFFRTKFPFSNPFDVREGLLFALLEQSLLPSWVFFSTYLTNKHPLLYPFRKCRLTQEPLLLFCSCPLYLTLSTFFPHRLDFSMSVLRPCFLCILRSACCAGLKQWDTSSNALCFFHPLDHWQTFFFIFFQVDEIYHDESLGTNINIVLVRMIMVGYRQVIIFYTFYMFYTFKNIWFTDKDCVWH